MLEFVIGDGAEGELIEAKNRSAGKGHEQRRMRGNDELRMLRDHFFEQRHERELPNGRERRFRFIQQVKSAGHEARLKEAQKTFAVRSRVRVFALHRRATTRIRVRPWRSRGARSLRLFAGCTRH